MIELAIAFMIGFVAGLWCSQGTTIIPAGSPPPRATQWRKARKPAIRPRLCRCGAGLWVCFGDGVRAWGQTPCLAYSNWHWVHEQ
jgi:hypothetical protein